MNKNQKLLNSFVKYCKEHPEERFWQALSNWSKFGYIFGLDVKNIPNDKKLRFMAEGSLELEEMGLKDTFYFEYKNN